ncbi:hypothetical protein [Pontibacter cellulosilyticus]|uniref:Uncharacterized protein n=1 Tax=Pontibacter cellulosilyticus TaxID=1720253 RepID=A0A923N7Y4_9BACT|nr:hypothetical protein [Pontibacter cellulosilyticus]MBC5993419.1 hypothetical protein [Pontibacter cellulosilyticus]
MTNYLYPLLLMLLLWQCNKYEFDDFTTEAQMGETFTVELGKRVNITGENGKTLTLYLHSVTDSRCPADAICAWLGNANVILKASSGTEIEKQVQMCIGDCRPEPARSKHTLDVEVGGTRYNITLKEVLPYPTTKRSGEKTAVKLLVKYQ